MFLNLITLLFFLFSPPSLATPHCSLHYQTSISTSKTYQLCMDLQTQQATIAWTFFPHNSTLDLVFTGTFISPSGWVAWGINPISPNQMTGTRSLIAFRDPNSGQLLVLPFILDPSVKLQQNPLLSRPLDLRLISSFATLHGSFHAGTLVHIFVTLKLPNNKTSINHVWNRGLYVQGYSPAIHPTSAADLTSTRTINMFSGAATTVEKFPGSLRTTHAFLNSFSWGFFLLVGVACARYLRPFPATDPGWFYAHMGFQLLGFSLGVAGFATGIRLGSMSEGVVYELHRKLGIGVFSLGSLQMMALFFRPKMTHKFRKYWKSYHHLVGYACVVAGVVNVFQGFDVMGLSGGSYWKLGYCLAISTVVGVCIALEINSWVVFCRKNRQSEGSSVEDYGKGSGRLSDFRLTDH